MRPEFRQRLGNPEFLQVLTPDGLWFIPIPDKPLRSGRLRSTDDHSQIAYEQTIKDWEEKDARIRGHQPGPRRG